MAILVTFNTIYSGIQVFPESGFEGKNVTQICEEFNQNNVTREAIVTQTLPQIQNETSTILDEVTTTSQEIVYIMFNLVDRIRIDSV